MEGHGGERGREESEAGFGFVVPQRQNLVGGGWLQVPSRDTGEEQSPRNWTLSLYCTRKTRPMLVCCALSFLGVYETLVAPSVCLI